MAIFQSLNEEGKTVVLITHEHDIAEYARRVVAFRDGRVVEDDGRGEPPVGEGGADDEDDEHPEGRVPRDRAQQDAVAPDGARHHHRRRLRHRDDRHRRGRPRPGRVAAPVPRDELPDDLPRDDDVRRARGRAGGRTRSSPRRTSTPSAGGPVGRLRLGVDPVGRRRSSTATRTGRRRSRGARSTGPSSAPGTSPRGSSSPTPTTAPRRRSASSGGPWRRPSSATRTRSAR